jgi:FixJ family two-component response regulator
MAPKSEPPRRVVHIVDDEPEVREALALLLSTAAIETKTYASAEAYLQSAPLGRAVCVLLDNRLPGLSGIDLLARIVEAGGDPAVIMMTGHGDVPTAVAAMKRGAFHFVEKPFDVEALLGVVEEALSRASQARDVSEEERELRENRAALTPREAEVFALLLEGLPTKTIAMRLEITVRTAEHHRGSVMRKFKARSIAHLLRKALSFGANSQAN